VISGQARASVSDAIRLAALQMQASFGDFVIFALDTAQILENVVCDVKLRRSFTLFSPLFQDV